jgi:hypothetical protein
MTRSILLTAFLLTLVCVGAEERGKLESTLWAEDPLTFSPVAISIDNDGRAYVTNTRRRKTSSLDIRRFRSWIKEDLSFESVDDRRAFYQRVLPLATNGKGVADHNKDGRVNWHDLMVEKDEVRILYDSTGDGKADKQILIDDDFHTEVTGLAAGIEWHDGVIYVASEPDIW